MTTHSTPSQSHDVSVETGRWVLFATILASSMAFIDGSALNVALPALQVDLGASGADLLWVVNGYLLMLASLLLVGGSLGDRYGRKRVFMIGIALFAGASLACGLAPSVGALIAARVVQGIGGAMMVPGSLALISVSFDGSRRGQAIGTWSAFSTITTVIGPVLGGALASLGLWRGVFFINVPLAVMALAALYLKVPESRDDSVSGRLDIPGALLVTVGLAGLTYGFIEAPGRGLGDPAVLLALFGGLLALIVFVIVEARSRHPMVSLSLFKSRTFSGANLLTLFLYAALSGAFFFLSLNMVQVQGYDPAVAGWTLLPFAVLLTILSRWAGGFMDRRGPRLPLTIGPAVVGVGFFLMVLPGMTGGPVDYWTTYFPAIVFTGIGMGITVAPLTTSVMGAVSANQAGIASGINNAVARTAGVLAIAILGAIALASFGGGLQSRTAAMDMPDEARIALQAEARDLGAAEVPPEMPAEMQVEAEAAIHWAFVDTFRLVCLIAAGLAWISALLAWLTVEGRPSTAPVPEAEAAAAD